MGKANKAESVIGKIMTYILVVLFVLGFSGVIVYFVAKDEGISFYVEYNGERYYSNVNESELFLSAGKEYTFSVKSLTGKNIDYLVLISSNGKNNFVFVCKDEFYNFYVKDDAGNNDYSEVFDLQKNAESFSISLSEKLTIEQIIEKKFGNEIQLQGELQGNVSYFVITVISGGNSLNFWLTFGESISGIELAPPQIIF